MLVIIASEQAGGALVEPLRAWSGSQLLDPVLLLTPTDDGALASRAVRRGEAEDVSVIEALRGVDLKSVVQVTVAIGPEVENPDPVIAAHDLASSLLERAIGADAWESAALVAIPDHPARRCSPELLLPAFDPWVVVAAEDRAHPAGVNTLIDPDDGHLARHAAHAVVALANAWSFTSDEVNYIAKARAAGAATAGTTDLVRCYTRLIDAGYLADHVAAQVLRPGVRWPNPDVNEFDDVDLEDDQNQAVADEFLKVHAPTLGLTEIQPLVHKRTKLSLWEAIKAVFRFMVDRLRRMPAQWLDDRIGKLYNTVAERVEGMGADVKVRRWREREPGEAPRDFLDELAARRLKVEPGAVGPTWEDMWRLSIGLVDGTALPTSLDLPFLVAGQRRLLETDPRLIVPDPEDRPPGTRDRAEYRSCDPKRFDPVVSSAFLAGQGPVDADQGNSAMGAWYKPRSRSLLWRIGVGIAQALNQAELEKVRPSTEDWDNLEELAAEVEEKTGKFRRRYFIWLLVRTVLAIAGSFALVFSDIPAWAQLAGPPVVWLLWLYLLGRGWQRTNGRVKALEDDAAERSEQLLHQLFLALVREADFERLGWRYAEYLDWAEIIGWYLHRPFVGREGEELDVAEALDPDSIPAALGAGLGDVGLTTFDTICQASKARLFLASWLKTYYETVRESLVGDWQEKRGLDSDQTRPTGFADNTRGAASLRRHLVAEARKGTGRRLTDNPMSPALLEQLSGRPLTKVIDGVVPIADGHEHWLPPVGAWLTDSTDLAQVADTIQPTVVRIRVEREDGVAGASGFVLRSTGLVVTNAHVVEGAKKVEVATDGGDWATGRVQVVASDTDLALVQVDTSIDLPVVRLGTSSDLSIGTRVFTLGFPKLLDGDPTFSSGEVTAARRFVAYGAGQMEVVQASYAATGGASGSPVFDSSGAVIGVHQGGAEAEDDQRAADYMSFAVPVDALRRWLAEVGELTNDSIPQPLRPRSGPESNSSLMDPQSFLDEVAEAAPGTLARDHGGDDAAFKSLSITDRTLIGWEDTATIRFLAPFRTGGSAVEAAAPQPAPRPDVDDGEDDDEEGGTSSNENDLV